MIWCIHYIYVQNFNKLLQYFISLFDEINAWCSSHIFKKNSVHDHSHFIFIKYLISKVNHVNSYHKIELIYNETYKNFHWSIIPFDITIIVHYFFTKLTQNIKKYHTVTWKTITRCLIHTKNICQHDNLNKM